MDVPNQNKIAAEAQSAAFFPAPILEALSARFRPSGVFVALMRRAGGIDYHDSAAGPFFLRYVLPLLSKLGPQVEQNADAPRGAWHQAISIDRLPGIVVARLAHSQKRATTH